MKNLLIKFIVAIFAFSVGVLAVYLSSNYFVLKSFNNSGNLISSNFSSPAPNAPIKNFSNKIEIRFLQFKQNGLEVEAIFELTNNTAEDAYYYSYSKGIYPFPKLKREGVLVQDNRGRCGTGIDERKLFSGESVVFTVPKWEVTYQATKNSWMETDKPTQIGFPFAVGERRNEELVWSEEIKFP